MATLAHDLANSLVSGVSLHPSTTARNATTNGAAVDLGNGDGWLCSATLQVGTVTGTNPTFDGKIQESVDGTNNWTDIPGATFAQVTTADQYRMISFQRTKRYCRTVVTFGGTIPTADLASVIVQQKKQL